MLIDAAANRYKMELWVTERERSYEEAMNAWRTSCPTLPVWEDANERGLVAPAEVNGACIVRVTASGLDLLGRTGPEPRLPGFGLTLLIQRRFDLSTLRIHRGA